MVIRSLLESSLSPFLEWSRYVRINSTASANILLQRGKSLARSCFWLRYPFNSINEENIAFQPNIARRLSRLFRVSEGWYSDWQCFRTTVSTYQHNLAKIWGNRAHFIDFDLTHLLCYRTNKTLRNRLVLLLVLRLCIPSIDRARHAEGLDE